MVRAKEQTGEQMAQFLHLDSWFFRTIVLCFAAALLFKTVLCPSINHLLSERLESERASKSMSAAERASEANGRASDYSLIIQLTLSGSLFHRHLQRSMRSALASSRPRVSAREDRSSLSEILDSGFRRHPLVRGEVGG